ncbi:PD-(D/E)XK nuclease superfamily protein [Xylanibacter ruminicola]|uniref:PD-(D/E)XK nuclease superfamily protein n=1 Tax=Xylanibacter ruminicola TaxID=839 RepID=UPI00048E251A|nr:PD-(D/E)XK nuclease superfamily protein [Xylanibacter ruminicola]
MPRNINTVGGGAQTNANGLHFEQTTELRDLFENSDVFTLLGDNVYKDKEKVATLYQKHKLYKNLLEPKKVDYTKIISKKLLPDDAILVHKTNTLFIIEKKFQSSSGSVDEKLQTCDFKKKQYTKLFSPLGIKVEYCYYLSEWFKQGEYRDVKEYIEDVGCRYFFDEIPLDYLGLE